MKPTRALWPVFLLCHFLVCGLLAWHLLAKMDFGYSLAYPLLDIDEHIEHYGPQNRYRDRFADTDKPQHLALFGQINRAIHGHPDRLATLRYTAADGRARTLLRPPEVVHLEDVARLIGRLNTLGLAALTIAVATGLALWFSRRPFPRPKPILTGVALATAASTLAVLLIGPKRLFYWFHTWVFPADHPWFFYYQDSLMTTLMKAPDLFGFIAFLLVLAWLALWLLSLMLLGRLWRRYQPET